jgi:hypothetical protein
VRRVEREVGGERCVAAGRQEQQAFAGGEHGLVHLQSLELNAARQQAVLQQVVAGARHPLAGLVECPETVAPLFHRERDRLARHHRLVARLLQQQRQTLRLVRQGARVVGHQAHARQPHHDPDDHQHHQDFDQGEAALSYSAHEPISASLPSPPLAPSAPRLKMSISLRTPGFRYW